MSTTDPADTFTRTLHAIDAKDWDGVRRAFVGRVTMDFSSRFGAATVDADTHWHDPFLARERLGV